MPRSALHARSRRNFHVPLPEDLYTAPQNEARHDHRPTNALAREAIARLVESQRQAHIDQAIREYAEAMAGSQVDFDPDLETASLESIGHDA